MTVPAQWALNQDAYKPRYEMAWVATTNHPMYQPLPPPSGIVIARSEQSNETRQSVTPSPQGEGGATVLQQAIPAATAEGARPLAMLASFYSIAKPIAVENFLQGRSHLVRLLFSAFPRIKSTWGTDVKPELTLVDDPEGGFPLLMVLLQSSKPDAYEALNRFDEEWWLDHVRDAEGLLNFSLRGR